MSRLRELQFIRKLRKSAHPAGSGGGARRRIESPLHAPGLGHDLDRRPARAGLRPALRPLDAARVHRPLHRPSTASPGSSRSAPVRRRGSGCAMASSGWTRRSRSPSGPHLVREHGRGGRGQPDSACSPSGSSPRARRRRVERGHRDLLDRAVDLLRQAPAICATEPGGLRRDWKRALVSACGPWPRRAARPERVGRRRRRPPSRLRSLTGPLAHMLPPLMRPRVALAVCLAAARRVPRGLRRRALRPRSPAPRSSATEAVEGEPIELAELDLQRPDHPLPEPRRHRGLRVPGAASRRRARGTSYLGVFMVIENETEEAHPSATNYTSSTRSIKSTRSLESESPYALEIGAEVPAEGQIPIPNTTAATGPEPRLADDLPGRRRRQRQPAAASSRSSRRRHGRRHPRHLAVGPPPPSADAAWLTAVAAAVVMLGLFSTGVAGRRASPWSSPAPGCTEPERSRRGGGWWMLVGAGAALAVAGFAIAELSEPAETAAGVDRDRRLGAGPDRRDDRLPGAP